MLSFVIFSVAIKLLHKKITLARLKNNKNNRSTSLPSHYCFGYGFLGVIFIFCVPFLSVASLLLLILNYFLFLWLAKNNFNIKKTLENAFIKLLGFNALFGIIITVGIVSVIFVESYHFFQLVSPLDFFFNTQWNPQIANISEPETLKNSFGILPVLLGTTLIAFIAMCIAIPMGIFGAVYLTFYSSFTVRNWLKPILEILAGVPTIVYGYFAIIFVVPFIKMCFAFFGIDIASENAFSCGLVMGIMITPFVLSLTEDALFAVPKNLKDGSLALGSTKSEMILNVALPCASPSIISALILAVSRAIGETMIVVMSAGLIANFTINPLNSVSTATVQIVTLLTGDQEFNSPKTLSAFAIALSLFVLTFCFNILAVYVAKKLQNKHS